MISLNSKMITEAVKIKLKEIDVEVVQKDIKNVHLSVYPPNGRVRVSAPKSMSLDILRIFVISKLEWVKKQQQKFRAQEREAPREYINRESHHFKGKRYLLSVIEKNAVPQVRLCHSEIVLQIRPDANKAKKQSVLDQWYRQQLKEIVHSLVAKWEKKINVSVAQFTVRKMKTRWGSCSPLSRTIRINLDLVKKPPEYLEYIVVHELVHLLEPSHNSSFVALMDEFLPKWQFYRDELNSMPVRHED